MISKISITNMRSLTGNEYEFGPGISVVCGPNGCGKTTLLEAVHLLSQGFSFRARELKEIVSWKQSEMIVRGEFNDEGIERNRGLRVHRGSTEVRENGESLRSLAQFFGHCPAVIMQPSDIELLRGAPETRRHWLDEILCYRSPVNTATLRHYKRILQQRNQWLKQNKSEEGNAVGGEEMFRILTQQLIELGAKLWAERLALVEELSPIITSYYRKLSGGVDTITCAYKSSILKELDNTFGGFDGDFDETLGNDETSAQKFSNGDTAETATISETKLRDAYARKLASIEFVEKMNGVTMSGPHKDDLALKISGYEMRSVGSQGQCRSAAVAMRFAAVDTASRYVGKPILLLDDIFAELDINRRDAVASLIREKGCQVIIATPQVEDLPFTADSVIRLQSNNTNTIQD